MKRNQRAVFAANVAVLVAGSVLAADGNKSAAPKPAPAPAATTPVAHPAAKPAFYEKYLTDDLPLDREIRAVAKKCADSPKDAGAHNDLGNLLALRAFPKEAHAAYREAEKLDASLYIASYNDGLLYEKQGMFERAKEAFRRTIRKKPGLPEAHFHLALIYEGEGSTEKAIAQYSEALRIDDRLRDPAFNPLSVQSRLIYRASIANYRHDIASAGLQSSGEYADSGVKRALSPEKPIFVDAGYKSDSDEDEEAEVAPAAPKTVTLMNNTAATPSARGNQPANQPGGQDNPVNPRPGSPEYRRQMQQRRYTPPRRTPPQSIRVPAPPVAAPPPPDVPDESNDQEPPPSLSF